MLATPTRRPPADDVERELQETRARLRAEHHHLTLGQQEMVAAEALLAVDAELVCDALVADESTVPLFVSRARQAADERERLSWLTLSALRAVSLKTPTMLALGAEAGAVAPDRAAALKFALEASGGAVTVGTLRDLLRRGCGRWAHCNEQIAAADGAVRRSWQVVRLAGHEELLEVTVASSRRRRAHRRRPRRRRSAA